MTTIHNNVGANALVNKQDTPKAGTSIIQVAKPLIGCGFGPGDGFHPGKIGPGGCIPPFPPEIFRLDAKREARELIKPVLNAYGAERLQAFATFADKVKGASTAGLKEALRQLDGEVYNYLSDRREVVELMRRTIEEELMTRPQITIRPLDSASDLIDDVANTSGAKQLKAFAAFLHKAKDLPTSTLEALRDRLGDRMVKESDPDTRQIYNMMLHAVNDELDSRSLRSTPGIPIPPPWKRNPYLLDGIEFQRFSTKLTAADAATQATIKSFVGRKE